MTYIYQVFKSSALNIQRQRWILFFLSNAVVVANMASPLLAFLLTFSLSTLSAAYSWNFVTPPQQCSNLTVSLVGSGGVPPYRILVLPFGATPLSTGVEVRTILDVAFPNNSTTVSFPLNYPANSQLVAVVRVYFFFLLQLSFFVFVFVFVFLLLFQKILRLPLASVFLLLALSQPGLLWMYRSRSPWDSTYMIENNFYVILLHTSLPPQSSNPQRTPKNISFDFSLLDFSVIKM